MKVDGIYCGERAISKEVLWGLVLEICDLKPCITPVMTEVASTTQAITTIHISP